MIKSAILALFLVSIQYCDRNINTCPQDNDRYIAYLYQDVHINYAFIESDTIKPMFFTINSQSDLNDELYNIFLKNREVRLGAKVEVCGKIVSSENYPEALEYSNVIIIQEGRILMEYNMDAMIDNYLSDNKLK